MSKIVELAKTLEQKRGELAELFKKHEKDGGYDMPAEVCQEVRTRNEELAVLAKEWEEVKALDEIARQNAEGLERLQAPERKVALPDPTATQLVPGITKTLGDMFVDSVEYKAAKRKTEVLVDLPDLDVKTLFQRTVGFAPESLRSGRVELYPTRAPVVQDLIPQDATTQSSIKYMEETTFTNAAAARAEGAEYPEAALQYAERSVPVEKVAVWLPVTEEQVADVPQVRALIDNRLTLMMEQKEEALILSGTGVSPEIAGFLTKVGVQTQAKGADPVPDAVLKAMNKVRSVGFANPTAIVIHPNDWQDVRLLRTTEGIYIWGSPAEAGPARIWGISILETTAITENTALLGDFARYSHISRLAGVTLEVSNSHSDFFIKGKLAIRAQSRMALEIYRPTAFCLVTGI